MTFQEKLSLLVDILEKKAEELDLKVYESNTKFSETNVVALKIDVSLVDKESLKGLNRNESKQ